jgi:hypothetical protein
LQAYAVLKFSHIVFETDKKKPSYIPGGKEMVNTVPESEQECCFSTSFRDKKWTP